MKKMNLSFEYVIDSNFLLNDLYRQWKKDEKGQDFLHKNIEQNGPKNKNEKITIEIMNNVKKS